MKKVIKVLSILLTTAFAVLCCTFFWVMFDNSQTVLNTMTRSMLVICYTLPVYLICRFGYAIYGLFKDLFSKDKKQLTNEELKAIAKEFNSKDIKE